MKIFTRTISSLLILAFLLSTALVPERVSAQLAVAEVNSTPNLFQTIIGTANSTVTSASTYSMELKAYVLDTLATNAAKMMIREITADVVDWINNGFEGSPAFMENPGKFATDMAWQISGDFLAHAGGPLVDLCNAFSIDIRLNLAFKYNKRGRERYKCTLKDVIENVKGAGDNITVNGKNVKSFMGGDFDNKDWPTFVTMTTTNQNNPYGAYLEANSELSIRVANAQYSKEKEADRGKGFLSWRNPKCKAEVKTHNEQMAKNWEALEDASGEQHTQLSNSLGGESMQRKNVEDCAIETPGSVIVSGLEANANGPLHELGLVDSINEIVNALAARLMTNILQGGLKAISGVSSSDSGAYVREIQTEAKSMESEEVKALRDRFIGDVEKARTNTEAFLNFKKTSLDVVLDVKEIYEDAKACYVNKGMSTASDVTSINQSLTNQVMPWVSKLTAEVDAIRALERKLDTMRAEATNAKTNTELHQPSRDFANMQATGQLTNAAETAEARQETQHVQQTFGPFYQDARMKLLNCQGVGQPGQANDFE